MPAQWDGLEPYVKKIELKGRGNGFSDYLTVPGRIAWFQHDSSLVERKAGKDGEYPHTTIFTEVLKIDLERGEAVIRAEVTDAFGNSASGIGWETKAEFSRGYVQKAETIAIGRALAMLGFNTQAALEADFRDLPALADTPVERQKDQGRTVTPAEAEAEAHLEAERPKEPPLELILKMAKGAGAKVTRTMTDLDAIAQAVADAIGVGVPSTRLGIYNSLIEWKKANPPRE